jgi:hypothetical protein
VSQALGGKALPGVPVNDQTQSAPGLQLHVEDGNRHEYLHLGMNKHTDSSTFQTNPFERFGEMPEITFAAVPLPQQQANDESQYNNMARSTNSVQKPCPSIHASISVSITTAPIPK